MDAQELKRREALAADRRQVAHWATPSGKHWVTLSVDGLGIFTYDGAGCGGTLGRMSEADALADIQRKITGGYFQPGKTPVRRVYRKCDRCSDASPGQLVQNGDEREALCFTCWNPVRETVKVLDWINKHGMLQHGK